MIDFGQNSNDDYDFTDGGKMMKRFMRFKKSNMSEQIKEFIRYKNCDLYKINDEEIVARSHPENYKFTRKENNMWIYGKSQRDKDKIVKTFKTEEEALLCMLCSLYTIKI